MYFTRRRFVKSTSCAGAFMVTPIGRFALWAAPASPASPCRFHSQSPYAPSIESFLPQIRPGSDVFVTEKYAAELEAVLNFWRESLCSMPKDLHAFRRALPESLSGTMLGKGVVTILRSQPPMQSESVDYPAPNPLSPDAFLDGFSTYLASFQKIEIAEFFLHQLRVIANAPLRIETQIHYNLTGALDRDRREQRSGDWELTWQQTSTGQWNILRWAASGEVRSRLTGPGFVDIAATAFADSPSYREQMLYGVDHWRTVLDGACGIDVYGNNGIAVGDFDGDGFDDLYVCQPAGLPNRLYRNRGDGTFVDATETSGVGVLDETSCAVFADLNNSGRQDLVVVLASGPLLFANRGDGTFDLQREAFRFARPLQGTFTGAAVADYDRDGLLDIYFCTYSFYQGLSDYDYPRPYYDAQNGPPNFLMKNRGNHIFDDVTASAGMNVNNNRFSFDCLWNDYNRDGWPDLYVVNDFGRKILYRNNGNGTFTDVSAETHTEDRGEGMSATFLDYDNDGYEDLYAVNMWEPAGLRVTAQPQFLPSAPEDIRHAYRAFAMGNTMLRNSGAPSTFADVTDRSGTRIGGWNWGSGAWDFDQDGYPDIYVANGFISGLKREDVSGFYWRQIAARSLDTGGQSQRYADAWSAINEFIRSDYTWSGYQRNNFYLNNRNGEFAEAAGVLGLDCIEDSRSFVLSDLDGDGRIEVVLKNRNSPQVRLFQNRLTGLGDSIAFALKGTRSNRDAIGAEVEVHGSRRSQRKSVSAGSGFLSQNSKLIHFGLGQSAGHVGAVVTWPDGTTQNFDSLPTGHLIEIREGSPDFKAIPFRARPEHPPLAAAEHRIQISDVQQTWLVEPIAPPDFALKDLEGKTHRLEDAKGQVQLLVFWTSNCGQSRNDLIALDRARSARKNFGLAILSVLIDEEAEPAAGTLGMHEQVSFPVLIPDSQTIGIYNVFYRYLFSRHREMPFPTSFLIDPDGDVVKVYSGSADPVRIFEDARNIPTNLQNRIRLALPFHGRYYRSGLHHNYFTYGVAYLQYGYTDQALLAFQRSIERNPSYAAAYYNLALIYLNKGAFDDAYENLRKTVALDPHNADAWNNLGVVEGHNGDIEGARRDFEQALDLQPTHLLALQNMVRFYRYDGRVADAVALLKRALIIDPSQAELHQGLAMLYVEQQDLDAAKSEFEEAVRLDPSNVQMLNGLGVVLMRTGGLEKAMEYFQQCQRLAPDFDRPYLNMADLYLKAGKTKQAHDLLTEYLARQPEDSDVRHALEEIDAKP